MYVCKEKMNRGLFLDIWLCLIHYYKELSSITDPTINRGGNRMTFIRWDPFRDIDALQGRIRRLFEDSIAEGDEHMEDPDQKRFWKPVVDIYRTEGALVIQAEVPGIGKDEISIELKAESLTIRGERPGEKAVAGANPLRTERVFGSFNRAFALPVHVRPDNIKARLSDGVLTIEIPKPEAGPSKPIKLTIE
jgi:HSP20 family protein